MDVSWNAYFSSMQCQRRFAVLVCKSWFASFIYGLFAQTFYPAGPNGIRGPSSYLIFGLNGPFRYRNLLAQVWPVDPSLCCCLLFVPTRSVTLNSINFSLAHATSPLGFHSAAAPWLANC